MFIGKVWYGFLFEEKPNSLGVVSSLQQFRQQILIFYLILSPTEKDFFFDFKHKVEHVTRGAFRSVNISFLVSLSKVMEAGQLCKRFLLNRLLFHVLDHQVDDLHVGCQKLLFRYDTPVKGESHRLAIWNFSLHYAAVTEGRQALNFFRAHSGCHLCAWHTDPHLIHLTTGELTALAQITTPSGRPWKGPITSLLKSTRPLNLWRLLIDSLLARYLLSDPRRPWLAQSLSLPSPTLQ